MLCFTSLVDAVCDDVIDNKTLRERVLAGFWGRWLLLLVVGSFLYGLSYFSLIKNFASDPQLTLLVAQTILEEGTTQLDGYRGERVMGRPFAEIIKSPKIIEVDGHVYSYFPTGPAILSLPFVALARLWDMDMSRAAASYLVQRHLAALSVVVVFVILWQMARLYVSEWASLFLSLTATLGSTIMSTMGTALWSINFATIFVALSLFLLVRGVDSWRRFTPYGLGVLLFLAFFARVSTAVFIAPVLLYLLLYERRVVGKTAVAALIPLILFLFWSRLEFGQWLPAYYSAARLVAERVAVGIGVVGNLVSPSRGIFVFSPFLGLGVLWAFWRWKWWGKRPLIPVILVWFTLLLLIVARGSSWWGGASFGPRNMTEVVPGLFLLVVWLWVDLLRVSGQKRRLWVSVYSLLLVLAIVIHSFQGLFNRSIARWNNIIDPIPRLATLGWGDLFEWRYTQLLATPDWNCALIKHKSLTFFEEISILSPYRWGQTIGFDEGRLIASIRKKLRQAQANDAMAVVEETVVSGEAWGFLPIVMNETNYGVVFGLEMREADGVAESYCREVALVLRLGSARGVGERVTLALWAGGYGEQRLVVYVNGVMVDEVWLREEEGLTAVTLPISTDLLNFGEINEVTIELPEATFTGLRGNSYNGLFFEKAALYLSDVEVPNPASLPPVAYP